MSSKLLEEVFQSVSITSKRIKTFFEFYFKGMSVDLPSAKTECGGSYTEYWYHFYIYYNREVTVPFSILVKCREDGKVVKLEFFRQISKFFGLCYNNIIDYKNDYYKDEHIFHEKDVGKCLREDLLDSYFLTLLNMYGFDKVYLNDVVKSYDSEVVF